MRATSRGALHVAGARRLKLEMLESDDGQAGDHADWLEPVLRR